MKKPSVDMTCGSIPKLLISFAIPLFIGNMFQQLYNTVDSLVVGNFVGKEALAAVGATTSVINTLVKFFNGVSIGAGVVISQCYGAHNEEKLHKAIQTTMTITFIFGIVFTLLGNYISPVMLQLMATPEDVFPSANEYLRIYFWGISGLLVYNMGSAILRAVGDTKRPLMFLLFSSILNIILDLFFVIVIPLGIAGVAYATILAQGISAILVLMTLSRTKESYRLTWRNLGLNKELLKKILIVGLPTGIQQSITALSNVVVRSYINGFGAAGMAGWTCYSKIDQFIMLPNQSMGQASTTFSGQNIGAGKVKRAKRGTFIAMAIALLITCGSASIVWILAPTMVRWFSSDSEVIYFGVLFLRMNVFFMLFTAISQVLAGALRGAGNARVPMVIMMSSYIVFRQLYLFIATSISYNPYVVGAVFPAGWVLSAVLMGAYYLFGNWEKKIVEKQ